MTTLFARTGALLLLACATALEAQVPQLINYQGRVAVGGVNFDGSGQFKFALVNAAGTITYWSNDGTSTAGSEPTAAVTLTVTKGLYSVLLGDATLPNMTACPPRSSPMPTCGCACGSTTAANGSQLLTPDQRIAAVGYAMMAGNVPDGAITSARIAAGAVGSSHVANGAVGSAVLAAGAVGSDHLAAGAAVANLNAAGKAAWPAAGWCCPPRKTPPWSAPAMSGSATHDDWPTAGSSAPIGTPPAARAASHGGVDGQRDDRLGRINDGS